MFDEFFQTDDPDAVLAAAARIAEETREDVSRRVASGEGVDEDGVPVPGGLHCKVVFADSRWGCVELGAPAAHPAGVEVTMVPVPPPALRPEHEDFERGLRLLLLCDRILARYRGLSAPETIMQERQEALDGAIRLLVDTVLAPREILVPRHKPWARRISLPPAPTSTSDAFGVAVTSDFEFLVQTPDGIRLFDSEGTCRASFQQCAWRLVASDGRFAVFIGPRPRVHDAVGVADVAVVDLESGEWVDQYPGDGTDLGDGPIWGFGFHACNVWERTEGGSQVTNLCEGFETSLGTEVDVVSWNPASHNVWYRCPDGDRLLNVAHAHIADRELPPRPPARFVLDTSRGAILDEPDGAIEPVRVAPILRYGDHDLLFVTESGEVSVIAWPVLQIAGPDVCAVDTRWPLLAVLTRERLFVVRMALDDEDATDVSQIDRIFEI